MTKTQKQMALNLVLLGVVLIAVSVYFFAFYLPQQQQIKMQDNVFLLKDSKREDIVAMSFYCKTTNQMIYQSDFNLISNQWMMMTPMHINVDSATFDKLFEDMSTWNSQQVVTNITPTMWKAYGFEDPSTEIQLVLKDNRIIKITTGRISPVENYYYVMLNDNTNKVYIVYAYKFTFTQKRPEEYIDRNLFPFPMPAVSNLIIKTSDAKLFTFQSYQGEKQTEWKILNAPSTKVDPTLVKQRILDMFTLRFQSFIAYERTPDLIAKYGLNNPKYYLKMESNKKEVLEIYISPMKVGNYYPAYATSKPGIFWMEESDIAEKFVMNETNFEVINTTNRTEQ